jgi:hypothetical protein
VLASYPGREDLAERAVSSIRPQVDRVALYWGGDTIPSGLYGLVDDYFVDSADRLGSAGKFAWLRAHQGLYLTFDDDLLYPENFVEHMRRELAFLMTVAGRPIIVSTHGRVLHEPDYRTARVVHRTCHESDGGWVNLAASCGLLLDTRATRPQFVLRNELEECDLAVWAQATRTPMYATPHAAGWIRNLLPPLRARPWQTIWERTVRDDFRRRNGALARHEGPWEVFPP